jgi:hypothetical protein
MRRTQRLTLTCKVCQAEFTPSRAELVAGPSVYRVCPACRRAPARK